MSMHLIQSDVILTSITHGNERNGRGAIESNQGMAFMSILILTLEVWSVEDRPLTPAYTRYSASTKTHIWPGTVRWICTHDQRLSLETHHKP